jgi:hypothetical protein
MTTVEDLRPLSNAVRAAEHVHGTEDFLAVLNQLRLERNLSYVRLGRRCQRMGVKLSRSRAQVMLTAKRMPTLEQLQAFLRLCGVSDEEQAQWHREFIRVQIAPTPKPIMSPAAPARAKSAPPTPVPEPSGWPALVWSPPRKRRMAWIAASRAVVAVVLATAAAIVLTKSRLPLDMVITIYATAMGVVSVRALIVCERPERQHNNRYVRLDDGLFENNELVAPPVIGE